MAIYKVKLGQNIWDVATQLYGSVEGILDLLVSNDWLDMTTDLKAGMELEYHDYFVVNSEIKAGIEDNKYLVANGERKVYHRSPSETLMFIIVVADEDEKFVSFGVSGSGTMIVDWGDNSPLQEVALTNVRKDISHYFDNKTDKRRVKVYGDFNLVLFDASNIPGIVCPVTNVTVDEFVMLNNKYPIPGLLLFDETYSVDLRGSIITDLLPVGNMSLQLLDIRDARIEPTTIDAYLTYIVDNYGTNRRPCTVKMTTAPTDEGMTAIQTIINEESWNQGGRWCFIINDETYQYSE